MSLSLTQLASRGVKRMFAACGTASGVAQSVNSIDTKVKNRRIRQKPAFLKRLTLAGSGMRLAVLRLDPPSHVLGCSVVMMPQHCAGEVPLASFIAARDAILDTIQKIYSQRFCVEL